MKQIILKGLVLTVLSILFVFPIFGLVEIRTPLMIAISGLLFLIDLKKTNLFYLIMLTPFIAFYFFYFFNDDYLGHLLSYWVIVLIGLMYGDYIDLIFKFLKWIVFINLLLVAYEFIKGDYIWNITEDVFFGRAKGFFSAPKEAGMFLTIFIVLFFERLKFIDILVIFITSFFTGSRTLLLITVFSFVLMLFLFFKSQKNTSFYFKIFVIVGLLLILLTNFSFLLDSFEVIGRLNTLLNLKEGGNDLRIYILQESIRIYSSGTISQILFGFGTKIEAILHNGSENAFLNILSRYGFVGFLFFSGALVIAFLKKDFIGKLMFTILIILLFGNRGLAGFLDGFVFFAYVSSLFLKGTHDKRITPALI